MKKKTLIFDCFGVVASKVLGGWIPDHLGTDFNTEEFFYKIDKGDMSEENILTEFCRLVNRPRDVVRKEIDSYFKLNLELIEYIKNLKSKKHKIILLSNATHEFFERFVFIEHPWFADLFDSMIISSKVKMVKPNSDIFLHALKENNLQPRDAIFIDDSRPNITTAEKLGISSILFKDTEQLKAELLKYDIS